VLRVSITHPTQDQPCGDLASFAARDERGEPDLGDLSIRDPLPELVVEDRVRVVIAVHTSSLIAAIAAVTARSLRAVIEKRVRCRWAAAMTSAP
jgi:hypothetical protein